MNPCKQHEKEDIDRHGSGFDCVYCRVEQLEADAENLRNTITSCQITIKEQDRRIELLEAVAEAAQNVEDNVAHPIDYQEGLFMNALYDALTALEDKDGD